MFRREEFFVNSMRMKNGHVVSDNVLIIMQISVINVSEEIISICERTTELLGNDNEIFIFDNKSLYQCKCKLELRKSY